MSKIPPFRPVQNDPIQPEMAESRTPDAEPEGKPQAPELAPVSPDEPPASVDANPSPSMQSPSTLAPVRTFDPRTPRPTLHPRRVVGGVKLEHRPAPSIAAQISAGGASTERSNHATPGDSTAADERGSAGLQLSAGWSWLSQRWMRPAEEHAPNDQLAEGLEYARIGQTRSLDVGRGLIAARVQGRLPTAYRTEIRLPAFDHGQWATLVNAMGDQAKYAASILAGELPPDIEDLFAPFGLRLFPADEQEIAVSCTCDAFRGRDALTREPLPSGPVRWCKHACCVMYLVAERLARTPMTIFALRGIDGGELLEQLRQARALSGLARSGGGSAPVYVQHVPNDPRLNRPLEELLRHEGVFAFWAGDAAAREAISQIDLAPTAPIVSHPLLRRLGASPFPDSKFPLVGLLATCYEIVGKAAIDGLDGLENVEPANRVNTAESDDLPSQQDEGPDA